MSPKISSRPRSTSQPETKKPLRVLLLCAYFPPEIGTASHLFHELAVELVARGHTVTVVTGFPRYNVPAEVAARHRGIWRRECMDGIEVLRVWWPHFRRRSMIGRGMEHFFAATAIGCRALGAGRHDVSLVYSPPLTLGITAWGLARIGRGSFVLNVQDLFPQSAIDLGAMTSPHQIAFFRWLERSVYKRAACVTVHSEGNAEHVRASAGAGTCVAVVPNWVDAQLLQPHPRDPQLLGASGPDGRFVVSFAGTMGFSQDMETIIRAASLLRQHDDILFLLVGDGVCKEDAQQLTEELELSNITFLPMQPREKYPQVLATSDASLVTLKRAVRTPVVPSKLLSIMASGRPAIVAMSSAGDAPRLVEEARCGLSVPPEDPERMAEAIAALYSDRTLAAQLGDNGRSYARQHFSVQACAEVYERIFRAVMRGDPPTVAPGDAASPGH